MEAGRRPSVLTQTAMTFAANSAGYVVAIITGIVVARELGPASKGVVSYAALVLGIFTTFAVGLQSAILRACGEGREQMPAFAGALRLVGVFTLPLGAALVLAGLRFPGHASLVYVGCALPFAVFCQTADAVFLFHNDLRTCVTQALIMTIGVGLVTIPALTLFHGGLDAALTIWSATFLAATAYTVVRLNAYLPAFSWRTGPGEVRRLALFALTSGSASLAAFLNLRIDVFVVSIMLDARALGLYTLAVATGEMLWQVSRPLAATTVGRVAAADRDRAVALTNAVTRNILAVECALGVLVFACAPAVVRFVYGAAYDESGSVVRWLLPGLVLYATTGALSYFLSVKEGRPAKALWVQAGSVACCAAISSLTIPSLGLFGAALATSSTYVLATLALATMYARATASPVRAFALLRAVDLERFARVAARLAPAARARALP